MGLIIQFIILFGRGVKTCVKTLSGVILDSPRHIGVHDQPHMPHEQYDIHQTHGQ